MSLLPFVNELVNELYNPRPSIYDLYQPLQVNLLPWNRLAELNSALTSLEDTKDCFKVNLDVQQFRPEEIKVKQVGDYLVVEAKHEERQDKHGYISREFTRRYKLPDNVEGEKIKSHLSSDGVLTLVAPKKREDKPGEIQIPIERTNQPALKPAAPKTAGAQQEIKQE